MKLFKGVKELDCIFCQRSFPLTQDDFKTINKHGWGCCTDCWELNLPGHTGAYIPPAVLRDMYDKKHAAAS
jgi:hypothetical protein